jgi:hypothetical protein
MIYHRKTRPGKSPWNMTFPISNSPEPCNCPFPGLVSVFSVPAFCFSPRSPTASPVCHGSDLMITLSLLVCHRVTAQGHFDGSRFTVHAFPFPALISVFCFLLLALSAEIACFPPAPGPEIACDSLCDHSRRLNLSQPISGYLNLSQPKCFSVRLSPMGPLLFGPFRFLPSAFSPRLSTAIRGYPRLSAPEFLSETRRTIHAPTLRRLPFPFQLSAFQRFSFPGGDPHSAQHFKAFQSCSKQNFYRAFGSAGPSVLSSGFPLSGFFPLSRFRLFRKVTVL